MCWKRPKGLYILALLLKLVESGWTPHGKIGGGQEAAAQLFNKPAVASKVLRQRELRTLGGNMEGNRAVEMISPMPASAGVFLCGTAMLLLGVWRWRGNAATRRCSSNGNSEDSGDRCQAFDASTTYIRDDANTRVEQSPEHIHGSWHEGHDIQKRKPCTELQDPAECLQDSSAVGDAPWVHSSPRHCGHCLNHATQEVSASATEENEEGEWAWLRAAHDFLFDELPEMRPTPQDVALLPEPSPSEFMPLQPRLQVPRRIRAEGCGLQFADGPEVREYDPQAAVLGETPCKGKLRSACSAETDDVERPLIEEVDEPHYHQCPPSTRAASPVISKFALRVAKARKPREPSYSRSTHVVSPKASKFALQIAVARMTTAEEKPAATQSIQLKVKTRCQL